MSRALLSSIVSAFALLLAGPGAAEDITPASQKAAAVIDTLDVEQHWPAGVHVHWESGEPDGRPETSSGKHTHCSPVLIAYTCGTALSARFDTTRRFAQRILNTAARVAMM